MSAILHDFGTNDFISVAMTRSDGVSVFPVSISSDLPQDHVFELINDVPTGVTVTAVVQTIDTQCTQTETFFSYGCYCVPEYTSNGCANNIQITNVSLSGESVDLDNDSECSAGAYAYYGDLAQPDLAPGEPYALSVSSNYGSQNYVQAIAWIDFNKDNELDEDEIIGNTNGTGFTGGNTTFNFIVPQDVIPGESYRLRVRLVYGLDAPTWDACSSEPNGETEDYKVTIIQLPDCEGTPTAGTIEADDVIYCPNSPILLLAVGASEPANGQIRIWQTSPTGDDNWTDIEGASPSEYTYSSMDVPSDIRYKVTCTLSGETDISNVISLNLNPVNECYCVPQGTDASKFVNDFSTTGGIDNISNIGSGFSTGGYGDFTEMTVKQVKTQDVGFTFVGGGSSSTYGFRVWVDWNQDGQFSSDEVAYQSSSYNNTHSGSITVPENALTGITRMRVVAHWLSTSGDVSPCETGFTNGEFEDYSFNVIPLDACEGIPTAGYQEEETMTVCAYVAFPLEVLEVTNPADGLTRIWQSSPAGQNDWTDIAESNSTFYIYQAGVGEPTDFRFRTACDFSDESDYSNVLEVTLLPGVECYCTPEYSYGCGISDAITNVSLDGESISLNNTTDCSVDAYGDYTEGQPKPDLAPGETYVLSVSTNNASPDWEQVIAWIDYNENGSFEPSEQLLSTNGDGIPAGGTGLFDFTLPDVVAPGDYRMRVRMVWNNSPPTWDACGSETYGETEDYTVSIIDLDACTGTPSAGTPDELAFAVCAMTPFNVSVSDASDAANGLIRVWQSSPAGQDEWTDILGASARNFQIANGINEPTDFRYTLECTNSNESDISAIIQVTLSPGTECYCIPTFTYGCVSYMLSNVTIEGESITLNNSSGCGGDGYTDYTTGLPIPDLVAGQAYSISVTTPSYPESQDAIAWIDYNGNGFFDTDEQIANTNGNGIGNGTATIEFTVPADVLPGEYRLRVRQGTNWDATPPTFTGCSVEDFGETEDYTVSIINIDACQGTPDAGTPNNAALNVCADLPFTVSVSGASDPAEGLTRIWQSSPAGQNEWTNISGATSTNYTVQAGINAPMDYRYEVTCANSEETSASDLIEVTLKPETECYCTPTYTYGCSSGDRISNVTLIGESVSVNNDSECSLNYYGDYTTMPAPDLAPTNTYTISVSTDYSSPQYEEVIAWIDYNQNGHFDIDEQIANTNGAGLVGGTGNFQFTIPATLDPGSYILRVRLVYESGTTPPTFTECDNQNFGETMDVLVHHQREQLPQTTMPFVPQYRLH